jgi:hypothetical protein
MKNDVEPDFLSQLDTVFVQLNPQAVEEFYTAYQQWHLQQRITELQQRIEMVREQQADNEQRLLETRPPAIALAALARLQSNGVSDIALLDAMLERGESWLDQTMQRLDYFEQFDDFINDDYTKWCQGALEGAFDWIDSLRENTGHDAPTQLEAPPAEESSNSEDAGEVEALLLQRLATEDEEDELSWQDAVTLKRTAIELPSPETVTTEEEQEPPAPEDVAQRDVETQAHIAEYVPQDEPAQSDEIAIETYVASSTGTEEQIIPDEALPLEESVISETEPEQPAFIEFAPIEEPASGEDELHTGDEQSVLIESAPIEEPSAAESAFDTGNEQPALVEFAAPPELTPAEETSDLISEQVTLPEIAIPEDIAAQGTAQSEVNEPDEMGNGAPDVAPAHKQQAIPTSEPVISAHGAPRKRGLIGTLIRILTGK